jgi:hypothetical protein
MDDPIAVNGEPKKWVRPSMVIWRQINLFIPIKLDCAGDYITLHAESHLGHSNIAPYCILQARFTESGKLWNPYKIFIKKKRKFSDSPIGKRRLVYPKVQSDRLQATRKGSTGDRSQFGQNLVHTSVHTSVHQSSHKLADIDLHKFKILSCVASLSRSDQQHKIPMLGCNL